MMQVSIREASADLPKLIHLLETRKEDFITVVRNGRPVAKITLINETPVFKRIGARKGKFTIIGDFDVDNKAITDMLSGNAL